MRPKVKFLENNLIEQIISEAIQILCSLGIEIHNSEILSLLSDYGAKIDINNFHVKFTEEIIDKAIKSAPSSFKLYDIYGNEANDLSGYNINFTPGSAALHILDYNTQEIRNPTTENYINYAKIVNQLKYIASQSTAFIPSDVNEKISDSYRLFLSLLYCKKPVITGAFRIESFEVMKKMLNSKK
ncbi:MAG: trimethylamine methyltransferase family protein [Candidatus Cloacimonetes bacterium]|nr:trimethylamine methyltransferase family protein [Candidatus Cloacimonadota bacterium]